MRKDFLTPPDEGSGVTCRTLRTPSDKLWLGVFNSALLTLLDTWRWEQVNDTDLTPDEAVAICQQILTAFWETSECDTCLQPGGMAIIGFDEFGAFKMLEGGEWVNPTGDYTVPPIPPREGGTDSDKQCLAAANAANVLKILYEQLADDYANDLSTAEAISNLVTAIALIIGAWLGFAIAAVIAIYRIMFQVVYETIEFVTADYWTEEFTDKLQCALLACSAVDGEGVVTFNMECLVKEIAETTNVLDNPAFVLLFGQVQAMLNIIGTDGLNAAGGTTAISSADCEYCDNEWCYSFDLAASAGGWTIVTGSFSSGTGIVAVDVYDSGADDTYRYVNIEIAAPAGNYTEITCTFNLVKGTFLSANSDYIRNGAESLFAVAASGVDDGNNTMIWTGDRSDFTTLKFQVVACQRDGGTGNGNAYIYNVQMRGTGANPFGEDNCE